MAGKVIPLLIDERVMSSIKGPQVDLCLIKNARQPGFALAQGFFTLAKGFQQAVESADQLADLVLATDRQWLEWLRGVRNGIDNFRGSDHGRELMFEQSPRHQPNYTTCNKGEQQRGKQNAALHGTDWG